MSFTENTLSPGTSLGTEAAAPVQFGRYTDCNKSASQLAHWNNALKFFGEKKYIDAYYEFFLYLGDPSIRNVEVNHVSNELSFTVQQGSKIIRGTANEQKVAAEVNIARFEKPGVAWMRKLMNMNYSLKYSSYAIKDDVVCMKFRSHTLDGSPTKLYFSLKELALNADKQDDLLSHEFATIKPIDLEHVIAISEKEKEVKAAYLQKWINDTLSEIDKLDPTAFYGAISYLLLTLTYRIDYLIAPEGKLAHDLEAIQTIYFAKDNRSYQEKNTLIIDEYRKMLAQPREYVIQSLYRTKCTFGAVTAAAHKDIADFIANEAQNAQWYVTNNYTNIVQAIFEYINGYNLFNFGMHTATRELSHLLMNILNQEYSTALGYDEKYYDAAAATLNKAAIEARIAAIIDKGKAEFPKLSFGTQYLNYNSRPEFAGTFLSEISFLDFTK